MEIVSKRMNSMKSFVASFKDEMRGIPRHLLVNVHKDERIDQTRWIVCEMKLLAD